MGHPEPFDRPASRSAENLTTGVRFLRQTFVRATDTLPGKELVPGIKRQLSLACGYALSVVCLTHVLGSDPLNAIIGVAGPIALSVGFACGVAAFPALYMGVVLTALTLQSPGLAAVGLTAIPAYWLAISVVRTVAGGTAKWLDDEKTAMAFLLGGLNAAVFSTLLGMLFWRPFLSETGRDFSWNDTLFLLRNWSRQMAGFIVLGPFVLVWAGPILSRFSNRSERVRRIRLTGTQWLEIPVYVAAAPAMLALSVYTTVHFRLNMAWLSLLPVLISARRGIGMASASLAASALSCCVAWTWFGWSATISDSALRTLLMTSGVPVIVLAALTEQRKKAAQEAERIEGEFRLLAAHTAAVRETERAKVCASIVRNLRPALAELRHEIRSAAAAWNNGDAAQFRRWLDTAATGVDGAIHSVRKIATELRPGILDSFGLEAALEWLVRDFRSRRQVPCALRVQRTGPVPNRIGTVYFRLAEDFLQRIAAAPESGDAAAVISLEGSASMVILRMHSEGVQGIRDVEALALENRVTGLGGVFESRSNAEGEYDYIARTDCETI